MDTLRDRLAELADDAPTTGAPAAELWARGKRAQRLRATALASMALLVVAVGARLGVALPDGKPNVLLAPGGAGGVALPIEYPVGQDLPDLGDTPGPLAAVWVMPPRAGRTFQAVGLVAGSGMFGTLPIELSDPNEPTDVGVALSHDGRRIAYQDRTGQLIVGDLVSGETYASGPEFRPRPGYTWIEATALVGRVAGGDDRDGWVWDQERALQLINPRTDGLPNDAVWLARAGVVGPGTRDHWVAVQGGGPRSCSPPILQNWSGRTEVPELCDVLSLMPAGGLLGHWNSDRRPGDWSDPDDGNGTVVALGFRDDDPRVVVAAGAPERVALAVDLIAEALEADGDPP